METLRAVASRGVAEGAAVGEPPRRDAPEQQLPSQPLSNAPRRHVLLDDDEVVGVGHISEKPIGKSPEREFADEPEAGPSLRRLGQDRPDQAMQLI